jgi:tripartite-type tricarboxylate transporter receptor subunit TctC
VIARRKLAAAAAALATPWALPAGTARAQAPPGGPIRLVVPLPPGGTSDLLSRVLGERIGQELGVPTVVENRPGGSTIVGSQSVARARPDGQTLLLVQPINIVSLLLQEAPPVSMTRDFAPIMRAGSIPMAVAVHASSPIRALDDLAAAARGREGGIPYGSAGPASMANLATVSLLSRLGVPGTNIPFRGNNDAIQALVGNQIRMMFGTMSDVLELTRAGTLRLLCVTTEERLPAVPEVPTTKELGLADLTPQIWYGYVVPVATPPDTVARLQGAFAKALAERAVHDRLAGVSISVAPLSGAEFMAFIEAEMVRWGGVIRANDIRLTN